MMQASGVDIINKIASMEMQKSRKKKFSQEIDLGTLKPYIK